MRTCPSFILQCVKVDLGLSSKAELFQDHWMPIWSPVQTPGDGLWAVGCGLIVGFKTLIKVRYFEIILPYFTHGKHCRSVTPAIRCKIIAICRIYTHVKPANQFRTGCRISLWIPFKQAEQSMTLCIFS